MEEDIPLPGGMLSKTPHNAPTSAPVAARAIRHRKGRAPEKITETSRHSQGRRTEKNSIRDAAFESRSRGGPDPGHPAPPGAP
ncbi:hypothetical protein GCM10010425_32960 [Streptomyces spororaveus]|uniref:Uncharacterized protein n=1 Tax=Streptomyces spororaveus TaxID=284039 RepID=A0ABQ3TKA0_9ACTN|nr:hypothetical protein Sspor_63740 [Streptomyces spororaveus]